MTDSPTVKRALRALALRRNRPSDSALPHEHRVYIERGATALGDVSLAASFVADDGLTRLDAAIDAARRCGATGVAQTGVTVRRSILRYQRAVASLPSTRGRANRSSHGTVLPDAPKRVDR
ncbi:MAG: hypothetical protein ACQETI_10320 [Halobacteriota archaeon]